MTDKTEDYVKEPRGIEENRGERPDRREEESPWLLSKVSKAQLLEELQKQHSRIAELEAGARELEETKRRLADCETKYRFVEENILDIFMAFDMSLRPFYCSPSIESLIGFTGEEITQRRIERILAPASLKNFMSRLAEQLSRESKQENAHAGSIELELVTKEGFTVPVSGRLRVVWEDDVPAKILLVIQDIRGQKLMEKALHEEIQRYRIFFQKAQEPMCIVTPQGTLVEVNDAWTKLLGYPPHEVLGLNVKNIMPEIVLAYTGPAETSSSDWETWLKKSDGSIITCLLTAITWAGPEQRLLGHLFIVRSRRETKG